MIIEQPTYAPGKIVNNAEFSGLIRELARRDLGAADRAYYRFVHGPATFLMGFVLPPETWVGAYVHRDDRAVYISGETLQQMEGKYWLRHLPVEQRLRGVFIKAFSQCADYSDSPVRENLVLLPEWNKSYRRECWGGWRNFLTNFLTHFAAAFALIIGWRIWWWDINGVQILLVCFVLAPAVVWIFRKVAARYGRKVMVAALVGVIFLFISFLAYKIYPTIGHCLGRDAGCYMEPF
jgi:hypothetical protein